MNDSLKLAFDRLFDDAVKARIKLLNLHIRGIEVTQSTQHYSAESHLDDPADRGADNSIPLIAGSWRSYGSTWPITLPTCRP